MPDILSASPIYQMILQEGREKEKLELLGQMLLETVSVRFPKLLLLAKQCLVDAKPALLKNSVLKVITARDETEAEQYLHTFNENKA